jgi:hypothetical protein
MHHRILKGEDGLYHVKGKTYKLLIGTRQQVGHGTAYKTSGGLTKEDLIQTKDGRWRSKKKHISAKKDNRLVKNGFLTKKGTFGWVRDSTLKTRKNKSRKNKQ